MSLKPLFLTAALLGLSPALFASVYVSDFSGASVGDPMDGVDGWDQSQSNNDPGSPFAWIGTLGSTNAGVVGGYYDAPAGTSFYANRNIGTAFSTSSITIVFSIQDSTTLFTDRNNFSFTVANGSGGNLFTVDFRAQSQIGTYDSPSDPTNVATSNERWDAYITSTGFGATPAFAAVGEDATYTLTLAFATNGSNVDFDLDLIGDSNNFTESGTLTGLASETFDELRVGFDVGDGETWGDNFIAFQAVPEPGSAMLLALSGVALLRRRRR